jgi:hypothetical protein
VGITVKGTYTALDHLKDKEASGFGDVGTLMVDRAYWDANKEPVFMYKMKLDSDVKMCKASKSS